MPVSVERQTLTIPHEAIDKLRHDQEEDRVRLGIVPYRTESQVLDLALKHANSYEEESRYQGDFIRIGVFKYPTRLERLRWQRTREVIRRVRPGVDEDPRYLAMLARHAASLELVLSQLHTGSPDSKMLALCDHVLLGTRAQLYADSYSEKEGDRVLVVLSYGFIDFVYQVAKAVVLSWRPLKPRPGTSGGLGASIADIEEVLHSDPRPLELLSKTLHGYMFEGRPRAARYDPPAAEYAPAARSE